MWINWLEFLYSVPLLINISRRKITKLKKQHQNSCGMFWLVRIIFVERKTKKMPANSKGSFIHLHRACTGNHHASGIAKQNQKQIKLKDRSSNFHFLLKCKLISSRLHYINIQFYIKSKELYKTTFLD